jgi:hypothetical protein
MQWTLEYLDENSGYLDVIFRRGEDWIELFGSLRFDGRRAYVTDVHIHGPGANLFGTASLREFINVVKGIIDVDTIYVTGAVRTTGANPGRKPNPLVF